MKTYSEQKEVLNKAGLEYLSEDENAQLEAAVEQWVQSGGKLDDLNEGFFGKVLGGAAGFLVGPAIGKIVAKALGINGGPLYDVLTSRLVSTALGAAIAGSSSQPRK